LLGALEVLVVYKVKWMLLAKCMTKQLFIPISLGFSAIMIVRFISLSFNVDETFKHITIPQIPLAFLCIFLFSGFFAVAISFLLKIAYVTIDNDVISGRNYWLIKRSFRMSDIEVAFPFSSNGMPVVVVDAGKKGQIYVPVHIENSDEIFNILDKYAKST
tara:strand:+ start:39 stop:518 length:480 start_codon:yes stop_codon:yes gene_type:complete